VLEQIRILSNLETNTEKLLQVVLVGEPELLPLLRSPELKQLDQRVSIRYQLKPLTAEEVSGYVASRLAAAGGTRRVTFTPAAVALVHELTSGVPRLVNILCDRALLGAHSAQTSEVDEGMVTAAAEHVELKPLKAVKTSWLRQLIGRRP
jgi:general secretion pathway protein A